MPKDINYQVGNGKISYYSLSENKMEDAAGYFNRFYIGGNSTSTITDNKGPEIDLFLNSTSFVDGGLTHPDPVLIVHLMDENGINVVGNSIGHDVEAILDDNSKEIYVLNDFYTGVLDAPNQGKCVFHLKN